MVQLPLLCCLLLQATRKIQSFLLLSATAHVHQQVAAPVAAWALCWAAERTCRCVKPARLPTCRPSHGASCIRGQSPRSRMLPHVMQLPASPCHLTACLPACMAAGHCHCQAQRRAQLFDARLPPAGHDGGGTPDQRHAVRLQGVAHRPAAGLLLNGLPLNNTSSAAWRRSLVR